jgi:hypothetical protein
LLDAAIINSYLPHRNIEFLPREKWSYARRIGVCCADFFGIGGIMHCVYCGVDYNFEDPCLCMPRANGKEAGGFIRRVKGPWGETIAEWSFEPETRQSCWVLMVNPAEA